MTQDYSQVNFRIPTKLKNKLEEAAKSNERSITGELVARLEKSFENDFRVKTFREVERSELPPESAELLLNVLDAFGYLLEKKTPD